MSHRDVAAFVYTGFVIVAAYFSGCATSRYRTDVPLHPDYHTSRDSVLHYRVPLGWFDATHVEERNSGGTIWLVRSDYAATISVSEVNMDPDARKQVSRQGLVGLARLTMGLEAGEKTRVLLRPPQTFSVNGREFCSYELANLATSDSVRVVLVDADEKVYELTALVVGERRRATTDKVYSTQQTFLEQLKW
ncbi:MAG: hypothetical protein HY708_05870 [Ignavibacteriae bacterium]|nr:hypothetical protein [Ignavibacteriota bacterium]